MLWGLLRLSDSSLNIPEHPPHFVGFALGQSNLTCQKLLS